MAELKKELNMLTLTLYGIGIILGAGIYALIGSGATYAGDMLWFAFLLAAIISLFTALSYAELSSIFSTTAAEYLYTEKAFKIKSLSFLVSWLLICASIISASVVALAFGGYFSYIVGGPSYFYAIVLIAILTLISYIGIKESAFFNNIASILEVIGLLLVIVLGLFMTNHSTNYDLTKLPASGLSGIFSAIGVIFFAFIGFEKLVNVGEEVKDSYKIVPKALLTSLFISSILYVLLSIAAVKAVGSDALVNSSAPLTTVLETVFPAAAPIISIIALFATSNTVLILLIGASRIIYGLSKQSVMPKFYSKISAQSTPHYAIITVGIVSVLFCFYGDIKSIAELTDLGIFITYFFVNLSLIVLRKENLTARIRSPTLFNLPIFAILGVLSSFFMLFHFGLNVWLLEILILIIGLLVYFVQNLDMRQNIAAK